jgi:large conductance mechanosensitive channel
VWICFKARSKRARHDFLIIAFAIFLVVKAMNSVKKKEEAAPEAPPAPSKEVVLLTEIRDALRASN